MAYKLQLKRGASGSLPTGSAGEPLFTTDTNDLYIGTGAANQRFQKYIASGTSSQFLKGDGSLDSNTYYLASNPSAYIALTALTASAPLSYNNTTGAFTISQASGSTNGYLSSTDWTTFNNKQNALTNPVTGTGTTNYLPKWTSGSAIGNSLVYDNGTNVGIGTSSPTVALHVLASGSLPASFIKSTNNVVPLSIYNNGSESCAIGFKGTTTTNEYSVRIGANGENLVLFTNDTEKMRLTSSGNLLLNSTSDNGNRLQVTGNGYFSGSLGVGTASPAALLHVNSTGTHTFIYSTISGSSAIALDNQGGDLRIFTGGGERMRIASTGAATFSSSVTATNLILNAPSGSGSGRQEFYTGGTRFGYIGTAIWATGESGTDFTIASVGSLRLATGDATTKMTITSGGNLLVGTSVDSGERLVVSGSAKVSDATPILTINGTTTSIPFGVEFRASGLDGYIKHTPLTGLLNIASGRSVGWGGFITFTTDTVERMRIKSDGIINISNVPSSATGLSAGDIYKDASGFLKIV